MIYESYSSDETEKIAMEISKKAKIGDIFCLSGDLGVGKTVFTKGFAKGLNIKDHITSPTFTIVNEYYSNPPFYHFDVYRISCEDEMFEIGFDEYIYGNGICLIEWAELIKGLIPEEAKWITISKDLEKGLDYRKIEVK